MLILMISSGIAGLHSHAATGCCHGRRPRSFNSRRTKTGARVHSRPAIQPPRAEFQGKISMVLRLYAVVPDLTVHLCSILDKLPKGGKKDSAAIFGGAFMAQAAYVIENPDKRNDLMAEYLAGVQGSLNVYAVLVDANTRGREEYLDDLIRQRDAGTLTQFVKERAVVACKK